jgi:hypothetical protein
VPLPSSDRCKSLIGSSPTRPFSSSITASSRARVARIGAITGAAGIEHQGIEPLALARRRKMVGQKAEMITLCRRLYIGQCTGGVDDIGQALVQSGERLVTNAAEQEMTHHIMQLDAPLVEVERKQKREVVQLVEEVLGVDTVEIATLRP